MNRTPLHFVYWFAYYGLDSPSVRYRGKYALDYLKAHHKAGSFFVVPSYRLSNILQFTRAYFSALLFPKKNSLIFIQRLSTNWIYATALKVLVFFRRSITVYDLDDADYLQQPGSSIFYFARKCGAVQVGSAEIARRLSQYNSQVYINTSPAPDLHIVKRSRNEVLTIGWIGEYGGEHQTSLEQFFFPALMNLPFRIKLVLLGVPEKELLSLHNLFSSAAHITPEFPQNIPWTDEAEIQQRVVQFDIGIATLLDTEMHRSKSGFKAKQYLNNGVPVLSTDLPENNTFIRHGVNGFLCNTPEDFAQRIIEINSMHDEQYARLCTNARASIVHFNLEKYCHAMCTFLPAPTPAVITSSQDVLNTHVQTK